MQPVLQLGHSQGENAMGKVTPQGCCPLQGPFFMWLPVQISPQRFGWTVTGMSWELGQLSTQLRTSSVGQCSLACWDRHQDSIQVSSILFRTESVAGDLGIFDKEPACPRDSKASRRGYSCKTFPAGPSERKKKNQANSLALGHTSLFLILHNWNRESSWSLNSDN